MKEHERKLKSEQGNIIVTGMEITIITTLKAPGV